MCLPTVLGQYRPMSSINQSRELVRGTSSPLVFLFQWLFGTKTRQRQSELVSGSTQTLPSGASLDFLALID